MAGLGSFLLALVVTSFLEYVVHRGMHAGWIRARRHVEHHGDGWGQGFWPELAAYVVPGWPVLPRGGRGPLAIH